MTITGTINFYPDSIINGKKVREMTDEEKRQFEIRWKEKHGGEVCWIEEKEETK